MLVNVPYTIHKQMNFCKSLERKKNSGNSMSVWHYCSLSQDNLAKTSSSKEEEKIQIWNAANLCILIRPMLIIIVSNILDRRTKVVLLLLRIYILLLIIIIITAAICFGKIYLEAVNNNVTHTIRVPEFPFLYNYMLNTFLPLFCCYFFYSVLNQDPCISNFKSFIVPGNIIS